MQNATRLLSRIAASVDNKVIQAHLDAVLSELESRDLWNLTASQKESRREAIARLRVYRDRGVFPKNYFTATRAPYLRDPHGMSCAVAYLLEESGRKDIVDSLVALDNGLYMEDARYPALLNWLEESGLTHEEACRIQVLYVPSIPHGVDVHDAPVKVFQKFAPAIQLQAPPDFTLLYILITIAAGTTVWLAYRWFSRTPRLKDVLPPLVYERRVGVESAVESESRQLQLR